MIVVTQSQYYRMCYENGLDVDIVRNQCDRVANGILHAKVKIQLDSLGACSLVIGKHNENGSTLMMMESTENSTNLGIQIVIFLGIIINLIANWRREVRQRKWQKEDALELAKKTEETARVLKDTTEQKAKEVKESTKKAIDNQTAELQGAMRTRLTDLGVQFDKILTEERQKRRTKD
jgi:hypothetical protein